MDGSKHNMPLEQQRYQHHGDLGQQQRAQVHNPQEYSYQQQQQQQQTILQHTQQYSNSTRNLVRNNFQQDVNNGRHRMNNLVQQQQQQQQQQQYMPFQGSNPVVNNMTTSSNNINLDFYQSQNNDFGRPQSIGANDALMRNNDSRPMLNMQTWTNNHVSQTPSTTNLLGGFSDESPQE